MPTTRVCVLAELPAERLWAKLAAYGTWNTWLKEVSESRIEGYDTAHVPVGAVRAVGPEGAPMVREILVACDDARRVITYEVAQEPQWSAPARRYRGTAMVIALTDGGRSVVEWSGSYDCDAKDEEYLADLLTGLYRSFINGLIGAAG